MMEGKLRAMIKDTRSTDSAHVTFWIVGNNEGNLLARALRSKYGKDVVILQLTLLINHENKQLVLPSVMA